MRITSHRSRVEKSGTVVYMAPLIDIIFLLLIFFMSAAIFYQLESELNISVPSAQESTQAPRLAGEVIINIRQDGVVVVNQRQMDEKALGQMLNRIGQVYTDQAVIIRADKNTYHKHVIRVLDKCASAGIWNISFATIKEERDF